MRARALSWKSLGWVEVWRCELAWVVRVIRVAMMVSGVFGEEDRNGVD